MSGLNNAQDLSSEINYLLNNQGLTPAQVASCLGISITENTTTALFEALKIQDLQYAVGHEFEKMQKENDEKLKKTLEKREER